MNTQTKVGVGVRLRLGLRFIISKKKGDVNMNMQTKVGVHNIEKERRCAREHAD